MNPVDKATFAAALAEQMRRQLDPLPSWRP